MSELMTSYCKLHNTRPADNEPCWQCINKFNKKAANCHDDLVAACKIGLSIAEWICKIRHAPTDLVKEIEVIKAALAKTKKE